MTTERRQQLVRDYLAATCGHDSSGVAETVLPEIELVLAGQVLSGGAALAFFAAPGGAEVETLLEAQELTELGHDGAVHVLVRHVERWHQSGEIVVERVLAAVFRFRGERIARVELSHA